MLCLGTHNPGRFNPSNGILHRWGVPVIATVQNRSTRLIALRACINRIVTYRARGATICSKTQLCSYWSTPVQGQSLYQWIPAQYLAIPESDLTSQSSSIISVAYALQIKACVPLTRNFSISVPIVVGNVPHCAPSRSNTNYLFPVVVED